MQSEQQLRRRAYREGLKLIKYRENGRWFNQYGPYALTDARRGWMVAYGMDLEDVERELVERS